MRLRELTAVLALCCSASVHADPSLPVGLWSMLDKDQRPHGTFQISEENGELKAVILQPVVEPGGNPDPICDKCAGANKDKPLKGLLLIWGLKKDGEQWDSGKVLNPHSGSVYSVRLQMQDSNTIKLRGYLGLPLLGITQTWVRQTASTQ